MFLIKEVPVYDKGCSENEQLLFMQTQNSYIKIKSDKQPKFSEYSELHEIYKKH